MNNKEINIVHFLFPVFFRNIKTRKPHIMVNNNIKIMLPSKYAVMEDHAPSIFPTNRISFTDRKASYVLKYIKFAMHQISTSKDTTIVHQ